MALPFVSEDVLSQPMLGPLTPAAVFLVVTVDPGGESTARGVLAGLAGLERAVGFSSPDGALGCVAGIGAEAWDRLLGGPRPAALHPFRELAGPRHRAVSTPGDLLFHIRAARVDLCFALAAEIMRQLRGAVTLVDEVQAFAYFDSRNLLGFVDGTENPVGRVAAETVLVGDEDPGFRGGSYVLVQKYLHDVDSWEKLPVEAQEKVVGRTKLTNLELDVEGSHVDVNTLVGPDGTERRILRAAMPFGRPGQGEFGTYFIAYARDPEVPEAMLRKMFIGEPPAGHDPILDFSRAVTGTMFFVPSADFLRTIPSRRPPV
ncbi:MULTISPECIES: Dyp-type peroxidase [Streptomyces]|uniref:Dyp-type peroxidase n=1 Tax=Streptomyces griseiscabiei TaxID=2993540 RepID=A0ABU4L2Z4_9ACTN|nr:MULTISPECIES: Dyp-type peroxidase [Streptomyces]MBZ3901371.1 Dyp-type peroxidase [Streptomyces griseiscabiei]MDX2910078.1 Dyp-type peroxidase [Streptomyces griseiscabiei]